METERELPAIRTLAQVVRYYHRLYRYDKRQPVPRDPRDEELRLRGERLQKRARDIRLARSRSQDDHGDVNWL